GAQARAAAWRPSGLRHDRGDRLLDEIAFRFRKTDAHRIPVARGREPDVDLLLLAAVLDDLADLHRAQLAQWRLDLFGFADLEMPGFRVLLSGHDDGKRGAGLQFRRRAACHRRQLPDDAVA